MRKIILFNLLFLILGFTRLSAQMVYIPDANFRTRLAYNYPGAIVGDSLNTQHYDVLTKTWTAFSFFPNGTPVNTFGLQFLVGLTNLTITYPPELPLLPPNLEKLGLYEAGSLSGLPVLPQNLIELSCINTWNLTYLPTLPNSLKKLRTYQTGIQILPYLITIVALAGFFGHSRAPKSLGQK